MTPESSSRDRIRRSRGTLRWELPVWIGSLLLVLAAPIGGLPWSDGSATGWWLRALSVIGILALGHLQALSLWKRVLLRRELADLRARLYGSQDLFVTVLWVGCCSLDAWLLHGTGALLRWTRLPVGVAVGPLALLWLSGVALGFFLCRLRWRRFLRILPAEEGLLRRGEVWLLVARSNAVALCEEGLFRLWALNGLWDSLASGSVDRPALLAILVSASVFALFHGPRGQPGGLAGIGWMWLVGMAAGGLVVWTGSVWVGALLHGPVLGTLGFRQWAQQWTVVRERLGARKPVVLLRGRRWYFLSPLERSRTWPLAPAASPFAGALDRGLVAKTPLDSFPTGDGLHFRRDSPTRGMALATCQGTEILDGGSG